MAQKKQSKAAPKKKKVTPEEEFQSLSNADKAIRVSSYVIDEMSKGNSEIANNFFESIVGEENMSNPNDSYIKTLRSQLGLQIAVGTIAVGTIAMGGGEVDESNRVRLEIITIAYNMASYIAHLQGRIEKLETKLNEK